MRTPSDARASPVTAVCSRNVTPRSSMRLRRFRATSASRPGRISASRASTVTRVPKSLKAPASSSATGPAPMKVSDAGNSVR